MAKEKNSIPDGAIRIHLYPCRNVLKPRGSMKKESLGLVIYERLVSTFEDWENKNEETIMNHKKAAQEMINWARKKYKGKDQDPLYMIFETHEATEGFLEEKYGDIESVDENKIMKIARKLTKYDGPGWSNPDYGDNPEPYELLRQLRENLFSEVETAWKKFISDKF